MGDHWFSPGHKSPPVTVRAGEPLWTLRLRGRQIDCELRAHGPYGVEVQLYRDLEFYGGRMFPTRELALAFAEAERKVLQPSCARCLGERWICEQHDTMPWPHDDCAGPGMPCPVCNVTDGDARPALPPDFRSDIKRP